MKLFDLFKSNKDKSKQQNISLEVLLTKSASEPAYRAEFYKRLLSDNLIVITEDCELTEGEHILEKDTNFNIVSYTDGRIPVFTSVPRIFDKGIIKEKVNYLEINGENLFKITNGATFLLNPYSDFGKELLPEEIENLLDGTIFLNLSKSITIEKDTKVQIGQPEHYPIEIVNSLKELFSERQNVNVAYLGWIFIPDSGEPPHYIFGIDANDDVKSLIQEAGITVQKYLKSGEFADFVSIGDSNGAAEYLKGTEPFYKK